MKPVILMLLISIMGLLGGCISEQKQPIADMYTLNGSVSYMQRVALPYNAQVVIQLETLFQPGEPAQILAKQRYSGVQIPIHFSLGYRGDEINPNKKYVLKAKIEVDGQLWFTNSKPKLVLTQGAPSNDIALLLDPVKR